MGAGPGVKVSNDGNHRNSYGERMGKVLRSETHKGVVATLLKFGRRVSQKNVWKSKNKGKKRQIVVHL